MDGSPTMATLMSPRRRMPSGVTLGTPPTSCNRTDRLMSSAPRTPGAMDRAASAYRRGLARIRARSAASASVREASTVAGVSAEAAPGGTEPAPPRAAAAEPVRREEASSTPVARKARW